MFDYLLIGSSIFISVLSVPTSIGVWLYMKKRNGQQNYDADRVYFDLTFPIDVNEKKIEAFIRSIGRNLQGGSTWRGVPTVVFETWARPEGGITHRLRVPPESAEYTKNQLRSTIPGTDIAELEATEDVSFQYGVTVHMENSSEEMPIKDIGDFATRVLSPMQSAMRPHDLLVTQWVIAHSSDQKLPPSDQPIRSNRSGFLNQLLNGNRPASHDEVGSRRAKQTDQNYIAIGRVAASSGEPGRAKLLVKQIEQALTSEGGNAYLYARHTDPQQLSAAIQLASTPLFLTAQFSVKELVAVIGWPISDSYITGLERGLTNYLHAPESVPRVGRVLGVSNVPGIDRPIAMDYASATTHVLVAGRSGSGKSNELLAIGRQDMEQGCGMILIERSGNLYEQMLDQVPPHRKSDVICIDLTRSEHPVGLNLLRVNKPEIIAGQFATLLDNIFPDASKGVNSSEIVLHGVPVIANLELATLADLLTLAHPKTPAEVAWAKAAVAKSPDKNYRDFWDDWYKDLNTRDQKQIAQKSQAFKNRMRELLTPKPTRYLVNQETSSFDPADVINGNKLLFVNLAGVSEQVASLIGTMIVSAIWDAAKRSKPEIPNFMYLDEFQQFGHLSEEFNTMLAEARKWNLGLVIATQYVERLKQSTQDAVMANVGTKLIFNSSVKAAFTHASDFASRLVTKDSILNLKKYDAYARIATHSGISAPMTLHTNEAEDGYNHADEILTMSAARYGRSIDQIERDDSTRRMIAGKPVADSKPVGSSPYVMSEDDWK